MDSFLLMFTDITFIPFSISFVTCSGYQFRLVAYFLNYGGKGDAKVHSERHRRSPIPSGGLEIILVAKFAISDEKQRYLVHLSTLIQRNYKVNEVYINQENGEENEDDIGLFDDDQADEDDIIILENDEANFS